MRVFFQPISPHWENQLKRLLLIADEVAVADLDPDPIRGNRVRFAYKPAPGARAALKNVIARLSEPGSPIRVGQNLTDFVDRSEDSDQSWEAYDALRSVFQHHLSEFDWLEWEARLPDFDFRFGEPGMQMPPLPPNYYFLPNVAVDDLTSLAISNASVFDASDGYSTLLAVALEQTALSALSGQDFVPSERSMLRYSIGRTAVSDVALEQLAVDNIIDYRERARDTYSSWRDEVEGMTEAVLAVPEEEREPRAIEAVLAQPRKRIRELESDLDALATSLFANLGKEALNANRLLIGAALGSLAGLSLTAMSLAILIGTAGALAPHVVTYLNSVRKAKRENPWSYFTEIGQ